MSRVEMHALRATADKSASREIRNPLAVRANGGGAGNAKSGGSGGSGGGGANRGGGKKGK